MRSGSLRRFYYLRFLTIVLLLLHSSICNAQKTFDEWMLAATKSVENLDEAGVKTATAEALKIRSNAPEPYALLSRYYFASDKMAEAMQMIHTAIELAPENPDWYSYRSFLYEQQNDQTAAISDARNAVIYSDMAEKPLLKLGILLLQKNKPDKEGKEIISYLMHLNDADKKSAYRSELVTSLPEDVAEKVADEAASKKPTRPFPVANYKKPVKQAPVLVATPPRFDTTSAIAIEKTFNQYAEAIYSWTNLMKTRTDDITAASKCMNTECIGRVLKNMRSTLENLYYTLSNQIGNQLYQNKSLYAICPQLADSLRNTMYSVQSAAQKYESASIIAKTFMNTLPEMKTDSHYQLGVKTLFTEIETADDQTRAALIQLGRAYEFFRKNQCNVIRSGLGSENKNAIVDAYAFAEKELKYKMEVAENEQNKNIAIREQKLKEAARNANAASVAANQSNHDDNCSACKGSGKKIKICWRCHGKGSYVETYQVSDGSSTRYETGYDRPNTDEAKLQTKKITTTRYKTLERNVACYLCNKKGFTTTDYNCPVCKGSGKATGH